MTQLSDSQLLERFRVDHDRAALDALVRRYIDLVYSAALRQVRDPHLAEDITQAVFIVLLRQARSIRADGLLAAWLFTVTRHAASNALRVRNRQRSHEMQKMLQTSEPMTASDSDINTELRDHLDDAIASLPAIERTSVLLHFFSNQTHKQVGQSLGMTEEAARKRVSRGLEKMRTMLGGRGVDVMNASVVAAALSAQPIPAGLIGSTVNVALLSSSIAPVSTSTASAIAEGVTRMIAISKIKVAAAVVAAVLLAGGVASPIVSHVLRAGVFSHLPVISSTIIETHAPATQPANAPQFVVEVGADTHVEFIGVSKYPPEVDSWIALDGAPIDCPDERVLHGQIHAQPEPEYMVAAKVTKPDTTVMRMHAIGSSTSAVMQMHDGADTIIVIAFDHNAADKTAKVELGISEGEWKTVASNEKPKEEATSDVPDLGGVMIHPIEENGDKASVTVDYPNTEIPTQIVAVDDKGTEHRADNISVRSDGSAQNVTCIFDVAGAAVKKIVFQSRPFSKFVDVSDISLEKGTITHPQIKVRDAKDGK